MESSNTASNTVSINQQQFNHWKNKYCQDHNIDQQNIYHVIDVVQTIMPADAGLLRENHGYVVVDVQKYLMAKLRYGV